MAIHNLKNDRLPPPPTYLVGIDVAIEKCTVVVLKADKTVVLKPVDLDNTRFGFEWLQ